MTDSALTATSGSLTPPAASPDSTLPVRQSRRVRVAVARFVPRRLTRAAGSALDLLGGFGIAVLALYPVVVVLALAAGILFFAGRHGPI